MRNPISKKAVGILFTIALMTLSLTAVKGNAMTCPPEKGEACYKAHFATAKVDFGPIVEKPEYRVYGWAPLSYFTKRPSGKADCDPRYGDCTMLIRQYNATPNHFAERIRNHKQ